MIGVNGVGIHLLIRRVLSISESGISVLSPGARLIVFGSCALTHRTCLATCIGPSELYLQSFSPTNFQLLDVVKKLQK